MWCIPEKPSAEFVVFHMEDVLEVYHRPYDPKRPAVGPRLGGVLGTKTRLSGNDGYRKKGDRNDRCLRSAVSRPCICRSGD